MEQGSIHDHVIRSRDPVLACDYICLDVNKYTYKCNKFSLFSHRLFCIANNVNINKNDFWLKSGDDDDTISQPNKQLLSNLLLFSKYNIQLFFRNRQVEKLSEPVSTMLP